jgi:hypothetical protein
MPPPFNAEFAAKAIEKRVMIIEKLTQELTTKANHDDASVVLKNTLPKITDRLDALERRLDSVEQIVKTLVETRGAGKAEAMEKLIKVVQDTLPKQKEVLANQQRDEERIARLEEARLKDSESKRAADRVLEELVRKDKAHEEVAGEWQQVEKLKEQLQQQQEKEFEKFRERAQTEQEKRHNELEATVKESQAKVQQQMVQGQREAIEQALQQQVTVLFQNMGAQYEALSKRLQDLESKK